VRPAEAYEKFLVPAIFEPWARTALRTRPPAPASRVLDVACGTGIGARLAARLVGSRRQVIGVDADAQMLSVARDTGERLDGIHVAWLRADALALPLQTGAFDYLLCLEGLQFFPDRSAGLRELRRVLRRGGEGLRQFVSAEAGRLPPFALSDAHAIRALLLTAGFSEVTVDVESLRLAVPSSEALVEWVAAGGPTLRHNLSLLQDNRRLEFPSSSPLGSRPIEQGRVCRCRARPTSSSHGDRRRLSFVGRDGRYHRLAPRRPAAACLRRQPYRTIPPTSLAPQTFRDSGGCS
jgi:SAM-dependent methyltransferase